jgi:hypothetical protein
MLAAMALAVFTSESLSRPVRIQIDRRSSLRAPDTTAPNFEVAVGHRLTERGNQIVRSIHGNGPQPRMTHLFKTEILKT